MWNLKGPQIAKRILQNKNSAVQVVSGPLIRSKSLSTAAHCILVSVTKETQHSQALDGKIHKQRGDSKISFSSGDQFPMDSESLPADAGKLYTK